MGPDQLLSLITNKLINHIALLLWNFVKKHQICNVHTGVEVQKMSPSTSQN